MELPPDHHLPQEPLLPTANMDGLPTDRRYDEDDLDNDLNDVYRLMNQHHVIGDSDEEVERIKDDVLPEHKIARQSGEESRELLGGNDR